MSPVLYGGSELDILLSLHSCYLVPFAHHFRDKNSWTTDRLYIFMYSFLHLPFTLSMCSLINKRRFSHFLEVDESVEGWWGFFAKTFVLAVLFHSTYYVSEHGQMWF